MGFLLVGPPHFPPDFPALDTLPLLPVPRPHPPDYLFRCPTYSHTLPLLLFLEFLRPAFSVTRQLDYRAAWIFSPLAGFTPCPTPSFASDERGTRHTSFCSVPVDRVLVAFSRAPTSPLPFVFLLPFVCWPPRGYRLGVLPSFSHPNSLLVIGFCFVQKS